MQPVIFKYPLYMERCGIVMPEGTIVLSVGQQGNLPYLWALHDTAPSAYETRQFIMAATGRYGYSERDLYTYIGVIHLPEQGEVYHVFEMRPL